MDDAQLEMAPDERSEFGLYWPILFAATVGVGLGTTGLMFYGFGQFVGPLAADLHWSRGAISGGMLSYSAGTVLIYPFVGRAVDRFGGRAVGLLGQCGLAAGFVLISLVPANIYLFDAAFFVMSLLGAGTSPIVWSRAVARHFSRRRGLALGIMLSGTGMAAVLAPAVVGGSIAAFGWRGAFRVMAAIEVGVGLPVTFFCLREAARAGSVAGGALSGMAMGAALRSGAFARLVCAFVLISVGVAGLIVHLPVMLADRGFAHARIGVMMGFFGYAVICGRLLLGFLMDRFPAGIVGGIFVLTAAGACLLLAGGVGVFPAVLLVGACAGAEVDLLAFLTSRLFGLRHFAQIYGWVLSAFVVGAGLGPVIAGRIHDVTGSYQAALYLFAGSSVAAAWLIGSLGRKEGHVLF